jgi:glycosyltransferase involved in cell wall biosynthesis
MEILRHYESKYSLITVIENEYNLGWQKNFINATKYTKGDFIFFADQDDVWDAMKLEKMLRVFVINKDVNAVVCNYSLIDGNGNHIERNADYTKNSGIIRELCFDEHFILTKRPGCALGIAKTFADKYIDFWSDMFPHDQFFEMLATILGGFYLIEEQLIKRRIHDNNTDVIHVFDSEFRTKKQNAVNRQLMKIKKQDWFQMLPMNKKRTIEDYMIFGKKRENALKMNSILRWIPLLNGIRYYPSIKTYLGDVKSIINSFTLIKESV